MSPLCLTVSWNLSQSPWLFVAHFGSHCKMIEILGLVSASPVPRRFGGRTCFHLEFAVNSVLCCGSEVTGGLLAI